MKKNLIIFLSIFFLFFYIPNIFSAEVSVINIHDGDTVTVKAKNGKKTKIRLLGIDAPELAQPYGEASRKHLISLLKGKSVTYKTKYKDVYGRSVGEILADNESVNLKMVKDGYAWYYKYFSDSEELAKAEDEARKKKLGLWKDKQPSPPWDFRKEQKQLPNVHNEPFFKSPIDNVFMCINPKTFYIKIQTKPCEKGLYTVFGSK